MGQGMYAKLRDMLALYVNVVAPELVDTPEKARQAGEMFQCEAVDMVVIFPFGYTPSMDMIPAVANLSVLIRLLNAHENHTYDFTSADTTVYLHHEGICCIPEFMARTFFIRISPGCSLTYCVGLNGLLRSTPFRGSRGSRVESPEPEAVTVLLLLLLWTLDSGPWTLLALDGNHHEVWTP